MTETQGSTFRKTAAAVVRRFSLVLMLGMALAVSAEWLPEHVPLVRWGLKHSDLFGALYYQLMPVVGFLLALAILEHPKYRRLVGLACAPPLVVFAALVPLRQWDLTNLGVFEFITHGFTRIPAIPGGDPILPGWSLYTGDLPAVTAFPFGFYFVSVGLVLFLALLAGRKGALGFVLPAAIPVWVFLVPAYMRWQGNLPEGGFGPEVLGLIIFSGVLAIVPVVQGNTNHAAQSV